MTVVGRLVNHNTQALANRLSGSTDWKAVVNAQPGGMAWVITENRRIASFC